MADNQKAYDPYRDEWHLLMDLAEGRVPPPRRRRMYDDNNEKPEQEDYTFHPLLPPTRLLAPSSNTETRPGPTIPPVSRATTHLSEQNPRTSIKVQEQLPPPSLSRFKRKRTMDEDEISLDEDYVEELTVSPDKQQTVTQPARDDVPPDIDIDMEVQSREDLPPDVEAHSRDDLPPDVDMEARSLVDATPANPLRVDDPPPTNQVVPWMDPYLKFMYFRYGFTYPAQGPEYLSHTDWKGTFSNEALRSTRALFLDKESVMQVLTPVEIHRHLFHFARSLSNGERPPTSLFDLDASNVTHLLQAGSVVTVIKLDIALSGAARPDNKNKNAWDDTRFRLQAGQIHEDWFLYVSDPSIAAECLRRHFVSTRDIVALFLRRGTPFVLGYEGDRPIPVPQPTRLAMIMPHDFAGDLTLFVEWETKARNFMQGPKSHLVWRLGGVYWRIALHLTGTIESALDSLDAPPSLVTRDATETVFEETLAEEDIDLIVGKYHVASNGKFTHFPSVVCNSRLTALSDPNQLVLKVLSWWPPPNIWADSFFDAGCWTPAHEDWFARRVKALRSGSDMLMSQRDWRSLFKRHRSTSKIIGCTRDLTFTFLKS